MEGNAVACKEFPVRLQTVVVPFSKIKERDIRIDCNIFVAKKKKRN